MRAAKPRRCFENPTRPILVVIALLVAIHTVQGEGESMVIPLPPGQVLRMTRGPEKLQEESFETYKVSIPYTLLKLERLDERGQTETIGEVMGRPDEKVGMYSAAMIDKDTLVVVLRSQNHVWLITFERAGKSWRLGQYDELDLVIDPVGGGIRGLGPLFNHAVLPHLTFTRNTKQQVRAVMPSGKLLEPLDEWRVNEKGEVVTLRHEEDE